MDLATKQTIIDKIRACPREKFAGEDVFDDDAEFELYRLTTIQLIEVMNSRRLVRLGCSETGESEVIEVDINRILREFDPIEVDDVG